MFKNDSHLLTVGLPLFNSGQRLRSVLDNLLNQSYNEFTLLISDNCSTDDTASICKEYIKNNKNIVYIRQEINIGLTNNFTFVLDRSKTKYFMWATDDDFRSPNFILRNLEFLELNPTYIGSGSWYRFDNIPNLDFIKPPPIIGDAKKRLLTVLENCWNSNGYSFSIFTAESLKKYKPYRNQFLANDWGRLAFLSILGNVHVSGEEFMICGSNGVSNSKSIFSVYSETEIEKYIPYYIFTKYIIFLSHRFSYLSRLKIYLELIKINIKGTYFKSKLNLECIYKITKPVIKFIRKFL